MIKSLAGLLYSCERLPLHSHPVAVQIPRRQRQLTHLQARTPSSLFVLGYLSIVNLERSTCCILGGNDTNKTGTALVETFTLLGIGQSRSCARIYGTFSLSLLQPDLFPPSSYYLNILTFKVGIQLQLDICVNVARVCHSQRQWRPKTL